MGTLDHVVWAVDDLDAATLALGERGGLVALPGGTHPDWGTRNAIVPIGGAYLELIAIADKDLAALNPFGRLVTAAVAGGGGPCAYCVAVDDVNTVAAGQGLVATEGLRIRADGSPLRWRIAGVDDACADPRLPFLITWPDPAEHPGTLSAPHRVSAGQLHLTTAADPVEIERRCGGPVAGVTAGGIGLAVELNVNGVPSRLGRDLATLPTGL